MEELKFYKPYTPSMRGTILLRGLSNKNRPCKKLLLSISSTGGRDRLGHITCRFRGSGNKKRYRIISFKRSILDMKAEVISIEYDPNRNADIALLKYENGFSEYIISVSGLKVGDSVISTKNPDSFSSSIGNSYPLSIIPVGIVVCCVEIKPLCGAKIARSAGSFVTVAGKENDMVILKMPSGETRLVPADCFATVGIVSGIQKQNTKYGKAGRRRWGGFRPHTRGECMNPVDHPLGGRTRGGHPVSPWGKSCKGYKTRKNKRTDCFIVKRRSNKK